MRKPAFCILSKNNSANQLRSKDAADQHFNFCYIDSYTIHVLSGYTANFVQELVGNLKDRFSRDTAYKHLKIEQQFKSFLLPFFLNTCTRWGM